MGLLVLIAPPNWSFKAGDAGSLEGALDILRPFPAIASRIFALVEVGVITLGTVFAATTAGSALGAALLAALLDALLDALLEDALLEAALLEAFGITAGRGREGIDVPFDPRVGGR